MIVKIRNSSHLCGSRCWRGLSVAVPSCILIVFYYVRNPTIYMLLVRGFYDSKIRQIVLRISQSLLSRLAAQIKYIFASPVFIFTRNSVPFLQFCTCMCPVTPVSLVTYGRLSSTTGFFSLRYVCFCNVYLPVYGFSCQSSWIGGAFFYPVFSWLSIRSCNCSFFIYYYFLFLWQQTAWKPVLRIRICRNHMFLGFPDPLVKRYGSGSFHHQAKY